MQLKCAVSIAAVIILTLMGCSSSDNEPRVIVTPPQPTTAQTQGTGPLWSEIQHNLIQFQTADFNGDNHLDLVVGSYEGGVYLYFNNGTADPFGDRRAFVITPAAGTTALGDFNGDGRFDMVVAQFGGPMDQAPCLYFANQGREPWFENPVPMPAPSEGSGQVVVTTDDIDSDGDLDLVAAHGYNTGGTWDAHNTIMIHRNLGQAPFFGEDTGERILTQSTYSQDVRKVIMADLNGDTHHEMIVVRGNQDAVSPAGLLVLSGSNTGDFSQQQFLLPSPGNYTDAQVVDLNNDGALDMILPTTFTFDHQEHSLLVALNQGGGITWESYEVPLPDTSSTIDVVDLDGDGNLELLTTAGNRLILLIPNPTDARPLETLLAIEFSAGDSPIQAMIVDDFDGDAAPDVMIGRYQDGIQLLLNPELRQLMKLNQP